MNKFNNFPITGEAGQERSHEQKRCDFQNLTEYTNQPLPSDDEQLDQAERSLMRLVKEGYFPAIKFLLENKGQNRGFGFLNPEVSIQPHQEAILKILNDKIEKRKQKKQDFAPPISDI